MRKFIEGWDRLFCGFCNTPIYRNPVPATCLVVIDSSEKLLLVKRSVEPKRGHWCLPGGFIELGEYPDVSALRELKEETGLSGEIDRLLGVSSNPSMHYDTILIVGYLVKSFTGDLSPGDDASDLDWFQMDRCPDIAFDSHRNFVAAYLKFKA